jgi:hypothetical protein
MKFVKRKIWWGKRVLAVVFLVGAGFVFGHSAWSGPQHGQATGVMQDEHASHTVQKWYCSIYPQIVRDGPGKCPICEMDLIPMPADLAAQSAPRELAVSEVAAKLMEIQTSPVERKFVATEVPMVGKVAYDETRTVKVRVNVSNPDGRLKPEMFVRAVVYVEKPEAEHPTFEGVEVVLGPRAGDYYIVRSGLAEGQRVVTQGNFKIDSALQIQAKPSMMSPAEEMMSTGHQGDAGVEATTHHP